MKSLYPTGIARALLESDAVTPATKGVLQARLDAPLVAAPRFFTPLEMCILRAACAHLLPQTGRAIPIDIAAAIDERLFKGEGNGWRYGVLPPDGEAYRGALRGLDESAQILFENDFVTLTISQQDEVLRAIQNDQAPGETWKSLCAPRVFEELLAEAAENYYAHPLAQDEIGYVGYADAHGWNKIGLNEREDREPLEAAHD